MRDVEGRLQGGEHGVTVGRRLDDLPGGQCSRTCTTTPNSGLRDNERTGLTASTT